jgi:hypothetical protein
MPSSFDVVKQDVRTTYIAMWTQRQLAPQFPVRPNWPEPGKQKTIGGETWNELRTWFLGEFKEDPDVAPFFSEVEYRFEAATSGTHGAEGVHDLKITPRVGGATVYNYHVRVID